MGFLELGQARRWRRLRDAAETSQQVAGVWSCLGGLVEAFVDERSKPPGQIVKSPGSAVEVLLPEVVVLGPAERLGARQELVGDDADRVHVGGDRGPLGSPAFRRGIRRRQGIFAGVWGSGRLGVA